MRESRCDHLATNDRLSGGDEILVGQGHGTPSTGRRGSMVVRRDEAHDDHLVCRQFHAADVHYWLTLVGGEENRGSLTVRRDVQNPRQAFVAALHPQPVEGRCASTQYESRRAQ